MAEPEPPTEGLRIRLARHDSEADQAVVSDLLSRRDGRHWSIPDMQRVLRGLDPAHCCAWIAFSGTAPVGLSTVFLKQLHFQGSLMMVAYWANLFVDTTQRHSLLYPRLVLATTQGIRHLGAQALVAGVRRPDLSKAHQRLGLVCTNTLAVLAKPLRPLRVGARYLHAPQRLASLAGLMDYLSARALTPRPKGEFHTCQITPESPLTESFLDLFCQSQQSLCFARDRSWMNSRVSSWKGNEPYLAIWLERDGIPTSGAILAQGTRGNGYLIGVILDLVAPTNAEQDALLTAIHHLCTRRGDDLVLWLPSPGEQADAARRRGYRSTSERYDILVHPPAVAQRLSEPESPGWTLTFLDHDAF